MTALASVVVSQPVGTAVAGTWTLPDDENTLRVGLAPWGGVGQVALTVECSLDGGSAWLQLGSTTAASSPASTARSDYGMTFIGVPVVCGQCGVEYVEGVNRLLAHSDVALAPTRTLPALRTRMNNSGLTLASVQRKILIDAAGTDIDGDWLVRTFHRPSRGVAPLRQIRVTITAVGRSLSSVLTLTSSP